ncbi:MAG: hypothetical protein CMM60_03280 [Rhodospirillaceae bacterium]|jgi:3-hydroxyacyl-[acyl-carrier-protein] dehydratase|nr:hypothetical protein [Rhodospirillaceae bacterium]|tara:strand:+ start:8629 stop:9006 length:378 start_codon:yes stop_codon:yes gene_type:complete
MSLVNKQITDLVKNNLEYHDKTLCTKIKFDKSFVGFSGHFPDNPVLPGVIMIKVMTVMYELFKEKKYRLAQIKQAKFIEPILNDAIVNFFITINSENDNIILQGKILKSEKIVSKISLVLQEKLL